MQENKQTLPVSNLDEILRWLKTNFDSKEENTFVKIIPGQIQTININGQIMQQKSQDSTITIKYIGEGYEEDSSGKQTPIYGFDIYRNDDMLITQYARHVRDLQEIIKI